jgi:type II secretory pathway predicted ATPase ExeA
MLSNIVIDKTMALQSFLLGQPQFRATLDSPELEQLRQRVTAAYHLGPLSEADTRAYVEHRLHRVEWKDDPNSCRRLREGAGADPVAPSCRSARRPR